MYIDELGEVKGIYKRTKIWVERRGRPVYLFAYRIPEGQLRNILMKIFKNEPLISTQPSDNVQLRSRLRKLNAHMFVG